MGIKERREKEISEIKKSILKAAMDLFVNDGYESVSIRKIAEKVEYSPSTIYIYFPDKDSILFELHNIGFEILYEKQLSVQKIKDPLERLLKHGRAYFEFSLKYPEYFEIMFFLSGTGKKILGCTKWDCGEKSVGILNKNVSECIEAGYFKGFDSMLVSVFMWSAMHGISTLYRQRLKHLENRNIDINNLFDNMLSLLKFMIK